MLKVVHEESEPSATGGSVGSSLVDQIVRDGARQMLAAALQAEVTAYIQAHVCQVDEHGHRLAVRNGYHAEREVTRAAGALRAAGQLLVVTSTRRKRSTHFDSCTVDQLALRGMSACRSSWGEAHLLATDASRARTKDR
jgi:hypothetical protein